MRLLVLLAAILIALPALAKGGAMQVDVELVLAVDVSYSMDEDEQRLQRGGYVDALTSPEFFKALETGYKGRIAIAYMEWAGASDQLVLVPWTLVDSPAAARALAERLRDAPYRRARRTSVSGAIDAAMALFAGNDFDGARQVIDISGDGPNNNGRPVTQARDEALAQAVTINGLPLLIRPVRAYAMDIEDLDLYYADCVIGGPGSFMIPVRDVKDFVSATKAKLVQEIARRPPVLHLAEAAAPRVSCMIGETLWMRRMGN